MNPVTYLDAVAKPQYVRLVDIFVLGPALLYTAAILPKERRMLRSFMVIAGLGTIYYNARNFIDIQQLAERDERMMRDAWVRLP